MDYKALFEFEVLKLKKENRYRIFKQINRNPLTFPIAQNDQGKNITVWCSNDYLGLGVNKNVVQATAEATLKYGAGSGGTRNISGTNSPIFLLEKNVALLCQQESALVFTSGYVANVGAISAITKIIKDIIVFSDEKNHASIIAGIKINSVTKHIFRHNDIAHLKELIAQYPLETPKIIIFEGVYSMDGTISDVNAICQIAKQYNALTYIDEVHAVGLYGERGAGIVNLCNAENKIDIIQGNFAKGLGVIGGYIAGKSGIIDAIRCICSDFIFTTSLPPALCVAASKSIEIVMSEEGKILRQTHQQVVNKTKNAIAKKGLNIMPSSSHIIPIMIANAQVAEQISYNLYNKHNIYVQNINYPTVPKGQERLRITPTPWHSDKMIDNLAEALFIENKT